ncbi:MAG: hypothetical protein B9S32_06195 [Verrucomicrobia bacterium Tous-C9LFEB]|nr:MAG: hypothetical protein B9S32_06195 [Verrucomicrobia bacterium Tous-C9LFEB]
MEITTPDSASSAKETFLMNSPTPDPLDALLKQSRPQVTLPTRFQAEVWQRIADRETASPWAPLRAWMEEWSAVLMRPRYALALMAVTILVGAGTAQLTTRPDPATMQARYVSLIDPYSAHNR